MKELTPLAERHDVIRETRFRLISWVLTGRRLFQNIMAPPRKFTDAGNLKAEPVIAVSETLLWNADDHEQNRILTAGKVQNLRLAAKRLNGIEVEANKTFSFWKHLGNPNMGKGYVEGREIREGCIVPTIAGGICQLSNALYDAALKAGFEITERHRHTKVIKGSLAEQDRDATVKWNYIDLRFKSRHPFRIEIKLTADQLVVQFRSTEKSTSLIGGNSKVILPSSKLNDCYSCGNNNCYKHPERSPVRQDGAITTFILDEKWSEFDRYIQTIAETKDSFIVPILKSRFVSTARYSWTFKNAENVKATTLASIRRALKLRTASKNRNIFSLLLSLDKSVAKAAAKLIPIESTHLVISQNLLPFLWEEGMLGGRTFDVLMTRLPMETIHKRLDAAHLQFPESKTLHDFRASESLTADENSALRAARHLITPHPEIAALFNHKSIELEWDKPASNIKRVPGKRVLFPGPALGRKGAYEMRRLARELSLEVIFTGKAGEDDQFWEGVQAEPAGSDPFDKVGLVVSPSYIEHQPRFLLKALAAGIPVIATTACGLTPEQNLTTVAIGDYDGLKEAVGRFRQVYSP